MCPYCSIKKVCPDSPEGLARKMLDQSRGLRIQRTRYGRYCTAIEVRVDGGKEFFDHQWIDTCPKCGKSLSPQ